MLSITLTAQELPDLAGESGPFAFVLERPDGPSGTAVLSIPIVNRGPESYAQSLAQERWVSQRYPDLEMCFAGAWRTDDLRRFEQVAAELGEVTGTAPLEPLWLLSRLRTRRPPELARAANGIALVNPRADVSDAVRRAARAEDLADYNAVIELAPQLVEGWLQRAARRHSEHEDYLGALADCREAARLQPAAREAWRGQGRACLALGRFDEAVQAFERAVQLSGGSTEDRVTLAYALEKTGSFARAEEQLREAAPAKKAGPARAADCAVHQARARCLAALDRREEALQALAAALRCQPGNSGVWLQRSRLLDAMAHRADEARRAAAKACALAQDWEVEPLFWHAALLRGSGRPQAALAALQTAEGRAPADPRLAGERGLALCGLGRCAEAVAELDRYLANVTWAPAQLARARCRRQLGDEPGALADLQAVLGAQPADPEALALAAAWGLEEEAVDKGRGETERGEAERATAGQPKRRIGGAK